MPGRGDELSKTMPVLPDFAADSHEADADADIAQHVDRALHRVGDGEIGVFVLVEPADEQNAAGEPDQLDQALSKSEVADESGALKRLPNHRHRRFIQKRPCKRTEETHWLAGARCTTEKVAPTMPSARALKACYFTQKVECLRNAISCRSLRAQLTVRRNSFSYRSHQTNTPRDWHTCTLDTLLGIVCC